MAIIDCLNFEKKIRSHILMENKKNIYFNASRIVLIPIIIEK